jgi:hypothetical protein
MSASRGRLSAPVAALAGFCLVPVLLIGAGVLARHLAHPAHPATFVVSPDRVNASSPAPRVGERTASPRVDVSSPVRSDGTATAGARAMPAAAAPPFLRAGSSLPEPREPASTQDTPAEAAAARPARSLPMLASRLRSGLVRAGKSVVDDLRTVFAPLFAPSTGWVRVSGGVAEETPESPDTPETPDRDPASPALPPGTDVELRSLEAISRADLVQLAIDVTAVDRSSTAYTRFKSWVDNAVNGSPGYDFHAADAAIMFLITRDTRYCSTGVGLVEAQVAAAESAIAGSRNPAVASDSYLDVGPMISDLAHVYQVCAAQMTASQRQRWAAYAEQAIWNVWNHQNARWGNRSAPWSGWSVTNPGNNYHYSFIEATMTWALASGSRTWFDFLTTNKLPAMQAYYATVPGGGSLEGTGYGTAQMRLFDLYRLWNRSTGQDLALTNTHARNTVPYWVHATVPTRDRFAPIGDQSRNSVPELYDYHRHLMLSARALSHDPAIRDMASWWLRNISVAQMGQGANFRYDALLPAGSATTPPAALHYAGAGTGHVFARTGWDTQAMWMAFVAGPYNESHAHQDQGSFTLFSRGSWLAVTENIWSRSGINQGTQFHNVVRFERSNTSAQQCTAPANDPIVHQCEGSRATATVTPGDNGALTITADLTPVYRGNPALASWNRRVDFGARRLRVLDSFALGAGTTAWFQLNVPVQPTLVDARTVDAGGVRVRVLQPANPTIRLVNWAGGDFNSGWRIDIGGAATTYEVELVER